MAKVSVIIPARGERFLLPTIEDVLTKATGDIEVIVVLDGWWPDPPLPDYPNLVVIHRGEAQGMRPAINSAAAIAKGDYLMKCDAHCMFEQGFDRILRADCDGDWVVVPRRYSLDAENWTIQKNGKSPVDAHFLSYPYEENRLGVGMHGQVWNERARERLHILIDDEMSSQGSCWFMSRRHFDWLGGLHLAGYGNFVQEFQEIGNKTWLGGGRVVVNKNTWYAHWHKGKAGRGYWISKGEMARGAEWCIDYWMNDRWPERVRDLAWLIEKFWPVPGWPVDWQERLERMKK